MGKPFPLEHLKGIDFPNYYLNLARNVVRRQKLEIPEDFESLHLFKISENLQGRWDQLFSIDQSVPKPLQTFYSRLSRDCLFDVLSRMRVNFANIMHLAVSIELHRPFQGFELNRNYLYEFSLKDVIHLNHNRAVLIFRSTVQERDGTLILTHEDSMFLSNLSPHDILQLKKHSRNKAELIEWYSGLTKIKSRLSRDQGLHTSFFLPRETGFRYGVLSGDLNPLHTQSWVCKLLGHNQSFVQGLFSTNLALKFLMTSGCSLRRLGLRFTYPAYVDQTIHWVAHEGSLEMQNEQGRLLAFGNYESFTGLES